MQTGYAQPVERPKSGIRKKNTAEEGVRRSQRLLLTWLTDMPSLYPKIKKFITPEDFTEELYRRVAEKLFDQLEQKTMDPAGIIGMFEEEEEQRMAAEVFSTKLTQLSNRQEREKAFHDIVLAVKENSYEQYLAGSGSDVNALKGVIEGKKALEELDKTHISIEES